MASETDRIWEESLAWRRPSVVPPFKLEPVRRRLKRLEVDGGDLGSPREDSRDREVEMSQTVSWVNAEGVFMPGGSVGPLSATRMKQSEFKRKIRVTRVQTQGLAPLNEGAIIVAFTGVRQSDAVLRGI
jgi:hypothetical protein